MIVSMLLLLSSLQDVPVITGAQVKDHIGVRVTVCGEVASTRFDTSAVDKPTFLNLDKPYPNQTLTFVIFEKFREGFGVPEERYRGKRVCGTGVIEKVPGAVRIVIEKPEHLREQERVR